MDTQQLSRVVGSVTLMVDLLLRGVSTLGVKADFVTLMADRQVLGVSGVRADFGSAIPTKSLALHKLGPAVFGRRQRVRLGMSYPSTSLRFWNDSLTSLLSVLWRAVSLVVS